MAPPPTKAVSTTNADRDLPVRTCVGCRRRAGQAYLVRCATMPDGSVTVSRTAPGRGAWVCGADCVATAIARRGFDRAWRRTTPTAVLSTLAAAVQRELDERVDSRREMEMVVRSGSTRHERLTTRVKG